MGTPSRNAGGVSGVFKAVWAKVECWSQHVCTEG